MAGLPTFVKLVEVGPRDGLQNEAVPVSIADRVALIDKLSATGLRSIEVGSFVNPKLVPQMADTDKVLAQIRHERDVSYPVLVPNMKGFQAAQAAGVTEIAVFIAASESFSQRNTNCSISESLARIQPVCEAAVTGHIRVRGYISCVLGCPYEGEVEAEHVAALATQLKALGCYEISLGDTIGTGTPARGRSLVEAVARHIPLDKIAVHFHDTYGQALANILAVLESGISVVDSAVAGLGGCPFAVGATGNVATEDVLYMLDGMGVETGIDLGAMVEIGQFITKLLGRSPDSRANRALTAKAVAKQGRE
jgi:hydroxymethylglutaryl-CoA lyase